jgi:hypothetical protein
MESEEDKEKQVRPGARSMESPEKMLEAFAAYREHIQKNPIKKMVFVGKDGDTKFEERDRPLTYEGFLNYCADNHGDVHHYFENTDKRYNDYREVCSRIRREIKQNQIEGGMAGIFNNSITQRLNGLVDRVQTDVRANIQLLSIDPIADADKTESDAE